MPINERSIRFPSFVSTSNKPVDGKPVLLVPQPTQFTNPVRYTPTSQYHHTSLLKRIVQKNPATIGVAGRSNEDLGDDLNDTDSYSISNEPMRSHKLTSHYGLERTENMKKIDSFLQMINELLVLPFSNPTIHTVTPISQIPCPKHYYNSPASDSYRHLPPSSSKSHHHSFSKTSPASAFSTSPFKYNESTKQTLANMEIVFALSMIVKHSHFFANAFSNEATPNNFTTFDTGYYLLNKSFN